MGENNNNLYRNNAGKYRFWNIIEGATPYSDPNSIAQTAENLGINWYGNSPIPPTPTPTVPGYVANKYQTTEKISSYHSGGIVIVAFCDGSTHYLRNDIEPNVLARLMMPYDVGKYAVSMGTNPTLVETKGLMPLTDSEYR
jgi:prepilin-type processing-associated H-X9-DG protein